MNQTTPTQFARFSRWIALTLSLVLLLGGGLSACAPAEDAGEATDAAQDTAGVGVSEDAGETEDADEDHDGGAAVDSADTSDSSAADTTPPEGLSYESLAGGTFSNEFFPEAFTLVEGHAEVEAAPGSASKITADMHPEAAWGDLDGDGDEEAAIVIYVSGGGSGTFRNLVAVDSVGGAPVQIAEALIGDRVQVDQLAIVDGRIVLDVTTHGPDDPMCCPTLKDALTYGLTGGQLLPVETE